MATLTELVDKMITRSKRPDKAAVCKDYLVEAARFIHGIENWGRDRAVATLTMPTAGGDFSASLTGLVRRRMIEAVYPSVTGVDQIEYKLLKSDPFSKANFQHYWYEMGDTLVGNSSYAGTTYSVHYFAYPQLGDTDGTFQTWLAIDEPDVLFYYAMAKLARDLGDKVQSVYEDEYRQQLRKLQQNYI